MLLALLHVKCVSDGIQDFRLEMSITLVFRLHYLKINHDYKLAGVLFVILKMSPVFGL